MDDGGDPGGHVDFVEHGKDEVVVDGVECFGGVKDENVVLLLFIHDG